MAVMGKKKRIVTLVTVHAILILLVFTALFPIALVVLNSFKPHVAIVANPLSWPESFIPVNYSSAWSYAKFGIGFKNSIILAACTIVIVLFASTLGGYVLATRRGKVVNLALVYFMIVMTIPIQLFLFPLYYVMSYLKLVGTVVPISFILAARNIPLALFLIKRSQGAGGGRQNRRSQYGARLVVCYGPRCVSGPSDRQCNRGTERME